MTALGRGILSQLSGAVNYTSVYYNDTTGNRVVKGPLGIVETYKFTTMQGVPKVTEIDRAANSPVVVRDRNLPLRLERLPQQPERLERQQHKLDQQQPRPADRRSLMPRRRRTRRRPTSPMICHGRICRTPIATNGLNANFTYDFSGNHPHREADRHDQHEPALFHQRPDADMDLYLQRHRPASDRAASPHGRDRQNHLRLYGRARCTSITDALSHVTTDQHRDRRAACRRRSPTRTAFTTTLCLQRRATG